MTHTSTDGLTLTRQGRIAVLTLDDGKANALRGGNIAALWNALGELEASDARALVLAGRPGYFSAGLDYKTLPTLTTAERSRVLSLLGFMLLRLLTFPRPVVAAVTGHALAGGALLALASDVRVGPEGDYRFGITEVAIGLAMPTFGVEVARASLSQPLLDDMLLRGRVVPYGEARDRGVFASLHPTGEVLANAVARAEALADLSPEAYGLTKRRLRAAGAAAAEVTIDAEMHALGDGIVALAAATLSARG
jgi:enoyl-CoA hydratase